MMDNKTTRFLPKSSKLFINAGNYQKYENLETLKILRGCNLEVYLNYIKIEKCFSYKNYSYTRTVRLAR